MAVDQMLMDFVVRLATDGNYRSRYHRATVAGRRTMLEDAGLEGAAIAAVLAGRAGAVENRLNTQVALRLTKRGTRKK